MSLASDFLEGSSLFPALLLCTYCAVVEEGRGVGLCDLTRGGFNLWLRNLISCKLCESEGYVQFFVTSWTIQVEFSRPEYQSG